MQKLYLIFICSLNYLEKQTIDAHQRKIRFWLLNILIYNNLMNIIKICKRLISPHNLQQKIYYFSKSSKDHSKHELQRNENYLNSKIPVNKTLNKQQKMKQIKQMTFKDAKDLRYLILGTCAFMGAIPFWAPLNIGIGLLNSGYILSRIGQQIKKYLLLVNNNQIEQLTKYRSFDDYAQLIFSNMIFLSFQSVILATSSFEVSSAFSMLWIAISIKQKILPKQFYLLLIPLFISIFVNAFSNPIKLFLLNQQAPKQKENIKKEKDQK